MKRKIKILIVILIAVTTLSIIYFSWLKPSSKLDSFAECVSSKATLYVSEGCPHCAEQEVMFGDSLSKLKIVECRIEKEKCITEGIRYIPTWDINGNKSVGVKSLQEIADATGCELPKE